MVACREFCETNDANRFSVVGNGESAVCSTDLYMVFGVSELGLCVSELGSEVLWWFSGGFHA